MQQLRLDLPTPPKPIEPVQMWRQISTDDIVNINMVTEEEISYSYDDKDHPNAMPNMSCKLPRNYFEQQYEYYGHPMDGFDLIIIKATKENSDDSKK